MLKKLFLGKSKYVTLTIIILIIIPAVYVIAGIIKNARLSATSYVSTGKYPVYPDVNLQGKSAEDAAKIKRGEYLAKAGDCIACHTSPSDNSIAFAGGLPIQTPFGVIYSPNITPDKETGIGNWTDADFIEAMREGVSPSGEYYFPAFPYLYFNQMTTEDIIAIKAYLDNIPPAKVDNKESAMIWPFNWRFLQLGWRILFFYPERSGPYEIDMSKSQQWNTGKYLVEGPGHCAMCHTPSYYIINENVSMGAPIRKYNLTGAVVEGYLAPNITKSNLGAIPDEELLTVFTQYHLVGGGAVQGPMAEAIHDSLIQLTKNDLLAMITYLKSVESKLPPQPDVSESSTGKSVYNNYCSGCHNSGVGGAPRVSDAKNWEILARSGMKKLYTVAINGGGNMPARGTCITCTNDEIRAAVDYMVAASRTTETQSIPVITTPATDEDKYNKYCSSCHTNKKSNAPQLGDTEAWESIEKQGFLAAYQKILAGKDHPANAGCDKCSDADILSALKYMMHKGSTKKNYLLW